MQLPSRVGLAEIGGNTRNRNLIGKTKVAGPDSNTQAQLSSTNAFGLLLPTIRTDAALSYVRMIAGNSAFDRAVHG